MNKTTVVALSALLLASPLTSEPSAQLVAGKTARIVYGHHHLNTPNGPEYRKFWVDALGGVPAVPPAPAGVVKFVNVLIQSGGGTAERIADRKGNPSYDHIALQVSDLPAAVTRVKAAGFSVVTRNELPDTAGPDDIAVDRNTKTRVAFVVGPDDAKVELIENKSTSGIALDHIHFVVSDPAQMQQWYVATFKAKPSRYGSLEAADLPGGRLVFTRASKPVTGTAGRVLGHLGIEIRDLIDFCATTRVKLDPHPRQIAGAPPGCGQSALALGNEPPVKTAFVTDPSGAKMIITEGMVAW